MAFSRDEIFESIAEDIDGTDHAAEYRGLGWQMVQRCRATREQNSLACQAYYRRNADAIKARKRKGYAVGRVVREYRATGGTAADHTRAYYQRNADAIKARKRAKYREMTQGRAI